jgi:biotin carboxylase
LSAQPALLILTELKMVLRHLRLIEHARELGVTPVLVVSKAEDEPRLRELTADPGHPLSLVGDRVRVSGPTVNGVLAGVAGLRERYRIDGVLSCGEYFVEPAAALAHLLGLPGTGWPAATISRNKLLQRYAVPGYAPRWRVLPPQERATAGGWGWAGPAVLKPVGRMSSSGVRELSTVDELRAALGDYPADEVLLLEERVTGPEFSVETLVQDGRPLWSGITDKTTNEGAGAFVETGHVLPAALEDDARTALDRANREVLDRIGLRDGVAHAEYRLAGRGPVLMEVAVRLPGDGITVLWRLATGRPMEDCLVELALGRPAGYPDPVRRAAHVYLDNPPGTLADVDGGDTPVSWTVRDARWPDLPPAPAGAPARRLAVLVSKLPGDELGPFADSDSRAVSVLVDAPLPDRIEQEVERARDRVHVLVK